MTINVIWQGDFRFNIVTKAGLRFLLVLTINQLFAQQKYYYRH